MKIFGGLILGLVLGIVITKISNSPAPQALTHERWAEEGVQKIKEISDPNEQLLEAERYYGKAVILFLASLYSQTNADPKTEVVDLSEPPQISPVTSEEKFPEVTKDEEKKIQSEGPKEKLTKAEKQAQKKDDDIKRMVAFQKSTPAMKMTPEVRKILGSFQGTFTNETGKLKGRVDQVIMDLQFEMLNGKLDGQIKIQLIDPNGRIYSNSNGNGVNQTLRPVDGKGNQIYVQTAPGEFIIMDVRNPDRMNGQYYNADGSYQGLVQIWRMK